MDVFAKCSSYTRAREVQASGFYPYFIPLEQTEGTEVVANGHRLIMIGSNNYLGLTNHPKVGELPTFNHALCGLYAAGHAMDGGQQASVAEGLRVGEPGERAAADPLVT